METMKDGVIQFSLPYQRNDQCRLIGLTEIMTSEADPLKFIEKN